MADFDWRRADDSLEQRYRPDDLGYRAWQDLVGTIRQLREQLDGPGDPRILQAFDLFLSRVARLQVGPPPLRVFVSHQQANDEYAKRVAYLAHLEGFEYWLDIHDPSLRLVANADLNAALESVLIAAIIEMALLNCTHGIALQTTQAQGSRWVPYEFGRAKRRWLLSTQVASWFDNGIYASTRSDYLKLGVCALSETAVATWLRDERLRLGIPPASRAWSGPIPSKLPN